MLERHTHQDSYNPHFEYYNQNQSHSSRDYGYLFSKNTEKSSLYQESDLINLLQIKNSGSISNRNYEHNRSKSSNNYENPVFRITTKGGKLTRKRSYNLRSKSRKNRELLHKRKSSLQEVFFPGRGELKKPPQVPKKENKRRFEINLNIQLKEEPHSHAQNDSSVFANLTKERQFQIDGINRKENCPGEPLVNNRYLCSSSSKFSGHPQNPFQRNSFFDNSPHAIKIIENANQALRGRSPQRGGKENLGGRREINFFDSSHEKKNMSDFEAKRMVNILLQDKMARYIYFQLQSASCKMIKNELFGENKKGVFSCRDANLRENFF